MYGYGPGPNGAYGTIQIMALDYVYRLWVGTFGNKAKPAAPGKTKKAVALETPMPQVGSAPVCCESY